MNILFVMSISGSIVFLLYLLTKPVSNRCLTARWQYNFLKACALFYLIPYQCFQNKYLIFYNILFGTGDAVNPLQGNVIEFKDKNTIYITPDGKLHYKYWLPLLAVSVVWLCAAAIMLHRQIQKYRSCRNDLLFFSESSAAKTCDIPAQHGIAPPLRNKPHKIICSPLIHSPFTIGLFRPIIVLPCQHNAEDLPLYLSHEYCHIRNHDALWKFAAFLCILIHWYNPLAYLLFYEIYVTCERNCDEMVTASLSETQRAHYEKLVIESARSHVEPGLLFADTFSTNGHQTKARIQFMQRQNRKSHWRKLVTALVICAIALSMPISVLAYQPVRVYRDLEDYSPNMDVMYIIFDDQPCPLDLPEEQNLDYSLSNEIIIDEFGNQYAITAEDAQMAQSCSHEYISGKRREHKKNGDGCTTYIYEGIYCKKCKYCLQESLIDQVTHTKCPH